jgi:hypothetical protein
MNNLPPARQQDVVIQEFDKEILIYDLRTHKIYNLNQTSSVVYRHCDWKTSFAELKRKYKFTDDLIHLSLDELREVNLIESENSFDSPFAGMSRREAIRKVGLASMVALPVITSLIAPRAVDAQSAATCTPGFDATGNGLNGNCLCVTGSTAGNPCTTSGGAHCKTGCTCIGGAGCDGTVSCSGLCQ